MNYQLNSYVNRQEAEALKEMIFKRARERANAMTSDIKSDVMDIARESFVSNNNPFSQILNQTAEKTAEINPVQEKTKSSETKTMDLHNFVDAVEEKQQEASEIGFSQRIPYSNAVNQNRTIKESLTTTQIQNNMIEARQGLSNRKSFMGALEFLNSQAAASLLNKRAGKGIDIVV